MKPRIVLNATTLVMGGAIQACVSFIRSTLRYQSNIEWVYLVSGRIERELRAFEETPDVARLEVYEESPAKSRTIRRSLEARIDEIQPDAVFTFFGPAYIKVNEPHLMGVADGWVTHSTRLAYSTLNGPLQKLTTLLRCIYKGWWYRYADEWVVEAECAKRGMSRRIGINKKHIHVVSNTCGSHYFEPVDSPYQLPVRRGTNILTLSAYYPHKNLEIIPDVARKLKDVLGHDDFQFVITLPHEKQEAESILSKARDLGVDQNLINIGPVSVKHGPALYAAVDVVFLPTLLETFSASYPEAMASKKPIVTADLDFAHDICGNSAMYYKPSSSYSAASAIGAVMNDEEIRNSLIQSGYEKVTNGLTPNQKNREYINIIKENML